MRILRTLSTLSRALLALPLVVACAAQPETPDPAPVTAAGWREIAAHEWVLVALDGAPPIEGADVTLAFADEGRLFGHTGANRYFAGVEHDDDGSFAATEAGSTRMFRGDPPGIMEQESRYLEALARVRGYRLVDGRLELLANGHALLAFESPR